MQMYRGFLDKTIEANPSEDLGSSLKSMVAVNALQSAISRSPAKRDVL